MYKGDKATLTVGNETIPMVFVGGGATVLAFSEVGHENLVYVFVPELVFMDGERAEDFAKDVLVEAYQSDPANPYLPRVEYLRTAFVDGPELGKVCKIFKMPHYRDLRMSDRKALVDMKILHKLRADGMRQIYDDYKCLTGNSPSMTFLGNAAAERTRELAVEKYSKKNPAMVAAIVHLEQAIFNRGQAGLTFEFNKRNIGVDKAGNLVMRDPVYDSEITVKIKRDRRAKEHENAD